jgi:hypothetical protein
VATAPSLTANGTAGAFTVTATWLIYNVSSNTFTYVTQTFNLTNTAAAPASLTAISGTPQSANAGAAFATALSAKVTDSGGNPLAGFTVTFTAPSSGASVVLSSSSAITNASGMATVNATANSIAGSYNVTASIGSLKATFALTNNSSGLNRCDVNTDGKVDVKDVQLMIDEALGAAPPSNDLNGDGVVDIVDVQIDIGAALNVGCMVTPVASVKLAETHAASVGER